jgi:hypothetical protein
MVRGVAMPLKAAIGGVAVITCRSFGGGLKSAARVNRLVASILAELRAMSPGLSTTQQARPLC